MLDTPLADIQTLSPDQQAQYKQTASLVQDILDADVIAVFSPLWNFGMPSHLKAWVEHVSRYNKLFHYDDVNGLIGHLDKKIGLAVNAMGGDYGNNSVESHWNHLTPHMATVFEFWGMNAHDITQINAVKLDISEQDATIGLETATKQLQQFVETLNS